VFDRGLAIFSSSSTLGPDARLLCWPFPGRGFDNELERMGGGFLSRSSFQSDPMHKPSGGVVPALSEIILPCLFKIKKEETKKKFFF
jgi:hypothetical protein